MSPLDRKLLRELLAAKALLVAIASIIAIGVSCFVAMQSTHRNLTRALDRYYRQCRMADFWIDLKKAPAGEIERLTDIPGVTVAQPRIRFYATIDLANQPRPINGLVIGLDRHEGARLNNVLVQRGDHLSGTADNEVLVNDAFAAHHHIRPGDTIHALLNNRRQELFVVGTAISSEFTYLLGPGALIPDPEHFGVLYITQDFAEDVFDYEGAANEAIGSLSPAAAANPLATLDRIEKKLEDYGVLAATPLARQTSNEFIRSDMQGLEAFANVLPVIFLSVAALVLNVLMTRLARQQRTVVGTLKAVGYSDAAMLMHFLKFGVAVGLLGAVGGCALGYAFAASMTAVYTLYYQLPDLRNELYPGIYGIGVAISVVCAVAGSLQAAREMLRLQPAEAMRPEPPSATGAASLAGLEWLLWRLDAASRAAVRNIVRRKFRTATGVFAAMMGAGLLVAGFMFTAAGEFLIDFQFYRVTRSDVDVSFKDAKGADAWDELKRLPGVELVEPQFAVAGDLVNGHRRQKTAVLGLLPDSQLTVPRDRAGRRVPLPAEGVVLGKRLAEKLGVAPGDSVTLEPAQGDRDPVALPVTRLADSYMGLVAYADLRYLSRRRGESLAMTSAQLRVTENDAIRDELYRELKRLGGVQSITTRRDMVEKLRETLLQNQNVMIFVLVAFAGAIFFGSVLNGSLVNLAERAREVGTLAALGYTRWEIGGMFLRESLVVTMIGAVLGLPVGYGLTWLTSWAFASDLIRFPVVVKVSIWMWALMLAFVFSLAAHAVTQWRIHRMDALEALKVKE